MSDTDPAGLASVIERAATEWRMHEPEASLADHIATAAIAHLASPEVVERAAKSLCIDEGWLWESVPPTKDDWRPDDFHLRSIRSVGPFQEDFLNRALAALRAACGEGVGS